MTLKQQRPSGGSCPVYAGLWALAYTALARGEVRRGADIYHHLKPRAGAVRGSGFRANARQTDVPLAEMMPALHVCMQTVHRLMAPRPAFIMSKMNECS